MNHSISVLSTVQEVTVDLVEAVLFGFGVALREAVEDSESKTIKEINNQIDDIKIEYKI